MDRSDTINMNNAEVFSDVKIDTTKEYYTKYIGRDVRLFDILIKNPHNINESLLKSKEEVEKTNNKLEKYLITFFDDVEEDELAKLIRENKEQNLIYEDKVEYNKRSWDNTLHNKMRKHFSQKTWKTYVAGFAFLGVFIFLLFMVLPSTWVDIRLFFAELGIMYPFDFSWDLDVLNYLHEYFYDVFPFNVFLAVIIVAFVWFFIYRKRSYQNMDMYSTQEFAVFAIVFGLVYPLIMSGYVLYYKAPTMATHPELWSYFASYPNPQRVLRIVVLTSILPHCFMPIMGLFSFFLATIVEIPPNAEMYLYMLAIRLEHTTRKKRPPEYRTTFYFEKFLYQVDQWFYHNYHLTVKNIDELLNKFSQKYLSDYYYISDVLQSNFDGIAFDILNYHIVPDKGYRMISSDRKNKDGRNDTRLSGDIPVKKQIEPQIMSIIVNRIDQIVNAEFQDYQREYLKLRGHRAKNTSYNISGQFESSDDHIDDESILKIGYEPLKDRVKRIILEKSSFLITLVGILSTIIQAFIF